jgi:deoxyribodipyrimidine photo-lyase
MSSSAAREWPSDAPVLIWFRTDLRLADNPALTDAVASGRPIVAVYVLEHEKHGLRPLGGASRWWLHHSLVRLQSDLKASGVSLIFANGDAADEIPRIAKALDAACVVWNRRYGGAERDLDAKIKSTLKDQGLEVRSHNGHLLREPWEVNGKTGAPMKVFTPYWRASRALGEPAPALPTPEMNSALSAGVVANAKGVSLESLALRPTKPDWSTEMATLWQPGEAGARTNLSAFLADYVKNYGENRNRPDRISTSRLSPHLKFGEISPRQIWHATRTAFESGTTPAKEYDIDKFLTEIGWREFSYHLLYQFPRLANDNFQTKFNDFPWQTNAKNLVAWQKGLTGYPIVDAGMRELWRTGWMHNRVRMIVGSFLVKHLLLDWRQGEDWFWDTLLDADPASNAASWQWVAGSGADAAPYFRIFAPVLQGEKFDPNGDYVRKYVPELAKMPKQFIHKPWLAPHPVLAQAGITLGMNYPHPIVIHEEARKRALAAFKSISAEQIA